MRCGVKKMCAKVNPNPAIQAGLHWQTGGTKKCRIPRSSGSKTKRNARQVFEGVCRAKRT